jgi:mannose-1-phosphate guanylyltransferase
MSLFGAVLAAAPSGTSVGAICRIDPGVLVLVATCAAAVPPLLAVRWWERRSLGASAPSAREWWRGLVTLGIPPTGPETGYGYLLAGDAVPEHPAARRCQRFTEKPDRTTAERFVADGRYYWNSGIFLWPAATFLGAVARHLPEHWRCLSEIRPALGTAEEAPTLDRVFPRMPRVSVDVGIMEKADDVYMIPATFSWDDVGAWSALGRILPRDDCGNAVVGRHTGRDTRGCVVYGTTRPIGTIGLRDIVVVETPEGVLVCPKERAQEVKDLVRLMREDGE